MTLALDVVRNGAFAVIVISDEIIIIISDEFIFIGEGRIVGEEDDCLADRGPVGVSRDRFPTI